MKISNLILTFVLALFVSFALQGQSKSNHVFSIHNDDGSLHIEYEEGKVVLLKVDGETIDPSDYSSYQDLIDKHTDPEYSGHYATDDSGEKIDVRAALVERIAAYLIENKDIDASNYKYKLTTKYLKLNGKKLKGDVLEDCLDIFEGVMGNEMTKGSYFQVKLAPGTKDISLSIVD